MSSGLKSYTMLLVQKSCSIIQKRELKTGENQEVTRGELNKSKDPSNANMPENSESYSTTLEPKTKCLSLCLPWIKPTPKKPGAIAGCVLEKKRKWTHGTVKRKAKNGRK